MDVNAADWSAFGTVAAGGWLDWDLSLRDPRQAEDEQAQQAEPHKTILPEVFPPQRLQPLDFLLGDLCLIRPDRQFQCRRGGTTTQNTRISRDFSQSRPNQFHRPGRRGLKVSHYLGQQGVVRRLFVSLVSP